MSDSFVWAAYIVTYGLIGGYVFSMVGRFRRHRGER
jgi:hypothetical protein